MIDESPAHVLNRAILLGQIVRRPRRTRTLDGGVVAHFDIKAEDGRTPAHPVIAVGAIGRFVADTLDAGDVVAVECRIAVDSWIDRRFVVRREVRLVVARLVLVSPEGAAGHVMLEDTGGPYAVPTPEGFDEELEAPPV